MTHTISVLLNDFFSVYGIAAFGIIGFALGFLLRIAINARQKRRILKLEDEMLNNHSRILALEKKICWLESENADLLKAAAPRKAGLKVS